MKGPELAMKIFVKRPFQKKLFTFEKISGDFRSKKLCAHGPAWSYSASDYVVPNR